MAANVYFPGGQCLVCQDFFDETFMFRDFSERVMFRVCGACFTLCDKKCWKCSSPLKTLQSNCCYSESFLSDYHMCQSCKNSMPELVCSEALKN